jgi:hypothetical protein
VIRTIETTRALHNLWVCVVQSIAQLGSKATDHVEGQGGAQISLFTVSIRMAAPERNITTSVLETPEEVGAAAAACPGLC